MMRTAAEIRTFIAQLAASQPVLHALKSNHQDVLLLAYRLTVEHGRVTGDFSDQSQAILRLISDAVIELSHPTAVVPSTDCLYAFKTLLALVEVFCKPLPPRKLAQSVETAGLLPALATAFISMELALKLKQQGKLQQQQQKYMQLFLMCGAEMLQLWRALSREWPTSTITGGLMQGATSAVVHLVMTALQSRQLAAQRLPGGYDDLYNDSGNEAQKQQADCSFHAALNAVADTAITVSLRMASAAAEEWDGSAGLKAVAQKTDPKLYQLLHSADFLNLLLLNMSCLVAAYHWTKQQQQGSRKGKADADQVPLLHDQMLCSLGCGGKQLSQTIIQTHASGDLPIDVVTSFAASAFVVLDHQREAARSGFGGLGYNGDQVLKLFESFAAAPLLLLLLEVQLLDPTLGTARLMCHFMLIVCDIAFYNRGPAAAAVAQKVASPMLDQLAPVIREVASRSEQGTAAAADTLAAALSANTVHLKKGMQRVLKQDVMDVYSRLLMKLMRAANNPLIFLTTFRHDPLKSAAAFEAVIRIRSTALAGKLKTRPEFPVMFQELPSESEVSFLMHCMQLITEPADRSATALEASDLSALAAAVVREVQQQQQQQGASQRVFTLYASVLKLSAVLTAAHPLASVAMNVNSFVTNTAGEAVRISDGISDLGFSSGNARHTQLLLLHLVARALVVLSSILAPSKQYLRDEFGVSPIPLQLVDGLELAAHVVKHTWMPAVRWIGIVLRAAAEGSETLDMQISTRSSVILDRSAVDSVLQQKQELFGSLQQVVEAAAAGGKQQQQQEQRRKDGSSRSSRVQQYTCLADELANLQQAALSVQLPQKLQQFGAAVCAAVPVLLCCNNPSCINTVKQSEQLMVQGKLCTNCKAVVYCSRECQKAHWKQHKQLCRRIAGPGVQSAAAATVAAAISQR